MHISHMIYAISDIHGHLKEFQEKINELIYLRFFEPSNKDKLILLGDYIERGTKSKDTLLLIKKLTENHPNKIIALKGNHEYCFLEAIKSKHFLTSMSYIDSSTFLDFIDIDKFLKDYEGPPENFNDDMYFNFIDTYPGLLKWLSELPNYYETEHVIFAHWGINETWQQHWKLTTSDKDMFQKYTTLNLGKFHKTVIAGHYPTSFLANDPTYHDIFFDGNSHYYIDGSVQESGKLNMLIYNEQVNKLYN